MVDRRTLIAILSILILGLAACAPAPEPVEQEAAAPPPPPEPEGPFYELTTDTTITSQPDWTSENITILGTRLGDRTNDADFGEASGTTQTLIDDYFTMYQNNGLGVYTFRMTGVARKIEVYQSFSSRVADTNLRRLLTGGDLAYMRELLGQEEEVFENAENMATEYVYDARGIRFIKYANGINAIRFGEVRGSL